MSNLINFKIVYYQLSLYLGENLDMKSLLSPENFVFNIHLNLKKVFQTISVKIYIFMPKLGM